MSKSEWLEAKQNISEDVFDHVIADYIDDKGEHKKQFSATLDAILDKSLPVIDWFLDIYLPWDENPGANHKQLADALDFLIQRDMLFIDDNHNQDLYIFYIRKTRLFTDQLEKDLVQKIKSQDDYTAQSDLASTYCNPVHVFYASGVRDDTVYPAETTRVLYLRSHHTNTVHIFPLNISAYLCW